MANATLPPRWADPDDDPSRSIVVETPAAPPPLLYQPALDGLRAVAVVAVLLYHGGVSWMPGGFLGVDLFFTLSGFLITSLLLREVVVGRVDYRRFWSRRIRRLFPALLAMSVLIAGYLWFWAPTVQRAQIRGDALATLAYVVNWRFVFTEASYFDQFLAPSPLRHAWSLAIEEQYYLLWPVLLTVLVLMVRRRLFPLAAVICGLALASMVWMWVLFDPTTDPSRVYYGTDTRVQSILVGAALAVVLARWKLNPSPRGLTIAITVIGTVALVALVTSWMRVGELDPGLYRGGFFLHAVGSVAVILAAIGPRANVLKWVLSIGVLRGIGQVSYGLYLYHWPIFLILNGERTGLSGVWLLLVRLLVTGAVAAASYAFIEAPIRSGPRVTGRAAWIATPVAILAVVGLLIAASLKPVDASPSIETQGRPTTTTVSTPSAPATTAPITVPVRVAVLGDSFAFDLGAGLQRLSTVGAPVSAVDGGRPGCGVARGGVIEADQRLIDVGDLCGDWQESWVKSLVAKPEFAVILSGAWEMTDRDVGQGRMQYGTAAHDAFLKAEFEAGIAFINGHGVKPVLVTFPYVKLREYADGTEPPNNDPARVRHLNRLIRQVGAATNTPVVDLNRFLAPDNEYTDVLDGVVVRAEDHAHFSTAGEEIIGDWLIGQLVALR